ncbi:DUF2690 domain-containing protein [Streptomyces sp. NPDC050636]|uniref:DUF2690 domain-containing protein n=1 Tax=Streptomyces sp. NPDC050636 TaxID=3154510 RepID=UPI003447CFE0
MGRYVVRLRRSSSCGAVWAEVRTHARSGVREVSINAGPEEHLMAYPKSEPEGSSSPMVATSSRWAEKACAVVAAKLACTSKDGSEVVPAPADWRPVPVVRL